MNFATATASSLHLALQEGRGQTFWLPEQASTAAGGVDLSFYIIYWIMVFFFVLLMGLTFWFVVKYHKGIHPKAEHTPHHNLPMELSWILIPLALVIVIFWYGFKGYMHLTSPPANAYQIRVEAQQWTWSFVYPNGGRSGGKMVDDQGQAVPEAYLHVPENTDVVLIMESKDVLHSFYIPQFRVKQDVVPGRYTKVWFKATKAGTYDIFCTEYCGKDHSSMLNKVVVQSQPEFEAYLTKLKDRSPYSPAENGEYYYNIFGCVQCHDTKDKVTITGPTFVDAFGSKVNVDGGATVDMDENYIRESILDPMAKIHSGFQGVMPTFKGKIKDDQINDIIAFIKTLSSNVPEDVKEALRQTPEPGGEASGEAMNVDDGNSAESAAAGDAASDAASGNQE
ncbi:MAG: cytochrome c oxidase subunit II [Planctomycetales bacterium]|nr:cytochrome c oxidase subunit II [bacterium]UNM07239.1 MAG: cytochrome c oxidase subunit II [Planctomycetales bacterium]